MRTPFTLRLFQSMPRGGWIALAIFAVVAWIGVPVAHLALPESHPLHVSAYTVSLLGKILCYMVVAVAMDLIWGYAGILSLGHGLFFALGGYAFGMYLMRQIGRDGSYGADIPDFMVFLDWKELPWYWAGSDSLLWALFLVVALPGLVAFVFGWFAFRSRIKGVYFSIITQALTYAAMLLFFRNETGFGGNNGFTDFKRILGYSITSSETRLVLFGLTAIALAVVAYVLSRYDATIAAAASAVLAAGVVAGLADRARDTAEEAASVARRRGSTIALAYAEWLLNGDCPSFRKLVDQSGARLLASHAALAD